MFFFFSVVLMGPRCRMVDQEPADRVTPMLPNPSKPLALARSTLVGVVWFDQKRCRTKSPRIFRLFDPNVAPEKAPNFLRIIQGLFVLCFLGNRDHKKFTKNPCHFSMPNPQANSKKNSTKVFWRAGKVTFGAATSCKGPKIEKLHSRLKFSRAGAKSMGCKWWPMASAGVQY